MTVAVKTTECCDHGCVVGTEFHWCVLYGKGQSFLKLATEFLISCNTTSNDNRGRGVVFEGFFCFINKGCDSGVLEARRKVCSLFVVLTLRKLKRGEISIDAYFALHSP